MDSKRTTDDIVAEMLHDNLVLMQAAWIEWKRGKGAEAAMEWVENALVGPGLIPHEREPHADHPQFYFSANKSNPFPKCHCGNPSYILWMGQGFCCEEHYGETKAKYGNVDG